jgi:Protein of unknown function (DUF2490)
MGGRGGTWLLVLWFHCVLIVCAKAQEPQEPEDPADDKQFGVWLDQGISADLTANKSLEFEFHERFDKGGTNLYEYFFQGGVGFRVRPWLLVIPSYRYQRFPGNPAGIAFENRLLVNFTMSTVRGPWRPNFRTIIEGRFPDTRNASARLRFRPGIDYTLPLGMKRPPVAVVSNEFFIVPGTNSFLAGSEFTQDRFQAGVRVPITDSVAVRTYYMLQLVDLPSGWYGGNILGFSLTYKLRKVSAKGSP